MLDFSALLNNVPPAGGVVDAAGDGFDYPAAPEDDTNNSDGDDSIRTDTQSFRPQNVGSSLPSSTGGIQFRPHQSDQWAKNFAELKQYAAMHGHTLVPHECADHRKLAKWVKRQRYQYKLKQENRRTTLTDIRQRQLEKLGFVWETHNAMWYEKFEALKKYHAKHGNCLVPSVYPEDQPLSVWVKYQRRQWKHFTMGRQSSMTMDRFEKLDALGFDWNPRNLGRNA